MIFFEKKYLAGQPDRMASATTIAPTTVLMIEKQKMILGALHEAHEFSDRFIAYTLTRKIRVEADLVDQLINSSEKRLARTLLLLARFGAEDHQSQKCFPRYRRRRLPRWLRQHGHELIFS